MSVALAHDAAPMNDESGQRDSRRIAAHTEQFVECAVHDVDVHRLVRIRRLPVVAREHVIVRGSIVHSVLRFAVTSRSRNLPSTTGAGPIAMSTARATSSVTFTNGRNVSFTKPESIM